MLRRRCRTAAVTAAASAAVIASGIGMGASPVDAATGPFTGVSTHPMVRTSVAAPVSASPASGTPELANTGSTEVIRQLAKCGGTMYAVGSFTTIKRYKQTFTRDNIFSFSAASPYKVTGWNPDVNGTVNSIAFSGHCSVAYIGGKFTSVHNTAVKNIAKISTSTGAVVTSFKHSANGQVETVRRHRGHLLVGGYFTSISGSRADSYMASLNTTTGKNDGFLHLSISGNYYFCGTASGKYRCSAINPTRVYNQQISHGGALDLVEGDFTSVGGLQRRQIFMLNLATSPATVTGWTSPEFDGSEPHSYPYYDCWYGEPFYIRAATWSADNSTVYIATTGYHPYLVSATWFPHPGLCDAVAAFPAKRTSVTHTWVNYTGCDSYYAAAADASALYVGGHERWFDNPNGCDAAGKGAISDPGMAGVTPGGSLLLNSSGDARYTRSRGKGADDMLVTKAGLWIASDSGNISKKTGKLQYSQVCNGVYAHAGICFLPY